ncbi:hypothetical protein D9757_012945 [Collybiopsis confluens]|uniref:Uncharacterized protein n=1 Tax=Collybiopsis confluens TaxID=2823264 RepID=A0A8H5D551_9AGAR|nr:hypothetical protein D9757_012945 [Collybiopsis confluens]
MLLAGFLFALDEGLRFFQKNPLTDDADVVDIVLNIQEELAPHKLMIELVSWPQFSLSDDPAHTCYIIPTHAANFSDSQFDAIGKRYDRLPQFHFWARDRDVLKKLREIGFKPGKLSYVTVFKYDETLAQVPPVPARFQAPWPPSYNQASRYPHRSGHVATTSTPSTSPDSNVQPMAISPSSISNDGNASHSAVIQPPSLIVDDSAMQSTVSLVNNGKTQLAVDPFAPLTQLKKSVKVNYDLCLSVNLIVEFMKADKAMLLQLSTYINTRPFD